MQIKQKEQIDALSSVADFVTQKQILEKDEVSDIDQRLDKILASLNNSNKFFKRLL